MHVINYSNCALTREFDRFVYGVGCRQQTTTRLRFIVVLQQRHSNSLILFDRQIPAV